MTEHTNKQFDADLGAVRSQFLQMGGIVEAMIQEAIEALASGDMTLVEKVREREKEVNRHEVEIDERIGLILARHQPTAIDLRTMLAVSKMLTDMERSGDEAEKVATAVRRMYENSHQQHIPLIELRHMAVSVGNMLHQALDAFARLDPILAAQVVRSDKEVDKEWKAALRNLITYMMEDPRTISRAIDMIFIARALERIGDHAKNMAERVIYMVKGADVRHTGVKNTERLARGEAPIVPEETKPEA
ncbi:phosphate transport system regulatory protein PhoU [Bordetella trematum]|uniref:Phosphate-specific transport system accessory protein PhoU n=1 Tax=Bordetella trematum TaxID=123899 RepID=A0A146AET3_9BORD|nr:phosphate signaling complex protein PhoU [Bordetella trematum]AUL47648.1 phosphate transport system regulatory protein PhoU [Bordetella trematum]AZR94517.1 phosphate transport system regulatory protein PhoU [Bordetella trematum]NNH19220.1 phosphate signaling complex protein PhoU [Bordetella trematum]QIM73070.1 phosphate signaling complex protein PhoU [Bordetella trematum]CZZ86905.1 phosphate transport system protein [Bordetella trematum]